MSLHEAADRARHAPSGSTSGARREHVLTALALVLAVVAVYAQVRGHEFLIYDDPDYVVDNANLRLAFGWESVRAAFARPYLGNWAPLTSLSLRLDYALYGLEPAGYLLANVGLHALATLALYFALARLTHARGRSAFVAGVFALHPLHVESVAWISERKDVLSGLFFALGLYAYAAWCERSGAWRYACVLLCMLLGLLAKATLVTFPCVLLLLDVWPLGRVPLPGTAAAGGAALWRRALLEKLPMFLLAALFGAVTFAFQDQAGAMDAFGRIPLADRLRNAVEAYAAYVASSLWPSDLSVFYPHPRGTSAVSRSLAAAVFLIGVSAWVARSARARPYLAVGWLWFLGVLVPMIGLVQVGLQSHADRYMYLPLIGLSILVAWGGYDLLARLRAPRLARPAALAILAVLGVCTWFQVQHWRNSFSLFQHALAIDPDNFIAHLELADASMPNDVDTAAHHYARANELAPQMRAPRLGLGDVLAWRGDLEGAIAIYERELQATPNEPIALGRYGYAQMRAGRFAQARRPLEIAASAHPGSAQLHLALAIVYAGLGRTQDAVLSNRMAIRLNPKDFQATNNLAWLFATREGASLAERQEAVQLAEEAVRKRGEDDASLLDTLAVAYAAAGRFAEATATAERAAAAADASDQPEVAREIRERGALFAAKRAYVEPAPAPSGAEG